MASLASLRLAYSVRYASSYLKLRNQRSIMILSAHRLLPSMLWRIPLLRIKSMYLSLVNWLPWSELMRPCLIGTVHDCITKQIRTDFCLLHALRQIHLWINRWNVHFTHISACFTATNMISAQFKLSRHLTGSSGRIIRMQMVNDSFAFQFFLWNGDAAIIYAGMIDSKQLCTGRNWKFFSRRKVSD